MAAIQIVYRIHKSKKDARLLVRPFIYLEKISDIFISRIV